MGNMSGVIIRRNAESGVISERFPEYLATTTSPATTEKTTSTRPRRPHAWSARAARVASVARAQAERPISLGRHAVSSQ